MYKKLLLFILCSIFLFACSTKETTTSSLANEEMIIESTGGASDKVPDPNVPELITISLYHPNENKDGITKELDGIDVLDAELLFLSLSDLGFLPENCTLNSFEKTDNSAILDLSNFNIDDTVALVCLKNTFIENFDLDALTISIDGNTSAKDLKFESKYKEIH